MNYFVAQDTIQKPLTDIPADTTSVDSLIKPKPPTFEEIRYWRWQREKKLVVDNSRYMKPQNEVSLSSTPNEKISISLPHNSKSNINTDWLTLIIFTVLLLFVSVKVNFGNYLKNLFLSVFNVSTASRMFNERNFNIFHASTRLELFFYIVFSIFIFQLIQHYNIKLLWNNSLLFLIITAATIAYFLVKKLLYRLLGLLFESENETVEYLFNMDNFNKISGLFLFPVVSLIAFNPFKTTGFIVLLGILVVLIFYIFMLQRGFYILLKKHFSLFYLFLYLCTLEFLPLLLIYKVVVM